MRNHKVTKTQAHGALGETSDKSDFSLHAWDSLNLLEMQ